MAIGLSLILHLVQLQSAPLISGSGFPKHSLVNFKPMPAAALSNNNVLFNNYWPTLPRSAVSGFSWTTFFPAYFTLIAPSALTGNKLLSSPAVSSGSADLEGSPSSIMKAVWSDNGSTGDLQAGNSSSVFEDEEVSEEGGQRLPVLTVEIFDPNKTSVSSRQPQNLWLANESVTEAGQSVTVDLPKPTANRASETTRLFATEFRFPRPPVESYNCPLCRSLKNATETKGLKSGVLGLPNALQSGESINGNKPFFASKPKFGYVDVKLLPSKNAEQSLYRETIAVVPRLTLVKALDSAAILWNERGQQGQFQAAQSGSLLSASLEHSPFAINVHRSPYNCWTVDFPNVRTDSAAVSAANTTGFNTPFAQRNEFQEKSANTVKNEGLHRRRPPQISSLTWSYQIFDFKNQLVAEGHCINRPVRKILTGIDGRISLRRRPLHGQQQGNQPTTTYQNTASEAILKAGDTVAFYPQRAADRRQQEKTKR